jgi:fermentation-respiration switch protein FrsA (DUF1100 family)
MQLLVRLVAGFATFYIVVLVALWAMQGSLLYPAPQDRPKVPHGFEEIPLTAEDGIETRAFFKAPARPDLPTVLHYHGNGETLLGSLASTRQWEAAGYGLMLPEYRGYGGNAGKPSEKGFYADGQAALDFLASKGIAGGGLVISGYSIGSGTAIELAVRAQPRALLLNAPFRSLDILTAEKVPWIPVSALLRDHFDNESKLANFTKPALITHGAEDTLIPQSHGRALAEAMPQSAFLLFEGLGHNQMGADIVVAAQRDWLEQVLATDSSGD